MILIFINMIRLKNLVLESSIGQQLIEADVTAPSTVYEFQDSFPDNIVLPIKTNQTNIASFNDITSINQLTPSLQDFINTLNSAVTAGKLKSGNITIAAEANSATAATKIPPKGWDQKQVDFSYSNGASVSNQTLADRRAEAIEMMIKKFVKLPADVTVSKSGNGAGSKKSASATVPILTYNKNTNTVVGPNKETVNPNAQKYTPPAYTDAKITLTKCGAPMKANGLCGNPIAYRTKLEPTSGNITITFSPYYVPDRCVITKFVNNSPTIIHDTGYVSSDPITTQVDFGKLLDELNKTAPNGYDGQIKSSKGSINVNLDDPNATYFLEVYAPLGPTLWAATLACQVEKEQQTSMIKAPDFPMPAKTNLNGFNVLYFNKDHTGYEPMSSPSGPANTAGLKIAWNGTLKDGKYYKGQQYVYDNSKKLIQKWQWVNGIVPKGSISMPLNT